MIGFNSQRLVLWSFNVAGNNIKHLCLYVHCPIVTKPEFHGTSISANRADTSRLSDGLTDMIKLKGERTHKLYIVVPTVSFVPSSIDKRVQHH